MFWLDVTLILTIIALAAMYVFCVGPTVKRSKQDKTGGAAE
jgi:hypothetical protein